MAAVTSTNSRVSLGLVLVLICVMTVSTIEFFIVRNKAEAFPLLRETAHACNWYLSQERQPTSHEYKKGQTYLKKWPQLKSETDWFGGNPDLSAAARWIVAGRVLNGMTKQQVLDTLGSPKETCVCVPMNGCDDFLVFEAADYESQCDLGVEFRDGKVFNAFLDVNY